MDSVTLPPSQQTESQESIAAKLAAVENAHTPTNPQSPPTAPAPSNQQKLAGRFDTVEDLEKAYKELQAEFTRRNNPNAQQSPTQPTPAQQQPPADQAQQSLEIEAQKQLEQKGLNFDEFAESYYKNGKLTDEDLAKLEAAGIGRSVVDTYIAGVEALRTQTVAKGYQTVGGEETFKAMAAWAAQNLSDADIAEYNRMVAAGGQSQELALLGLKAKWQAANPQTTEPSFVSGKGTSSVDSMSYASLREMAQDMADPRYRKDPTFTRMVEQKAARSKF